MGIRDFAGCRATVDFQDSVVIRRNSLVTLDLVERAGIRGSVDSLAIRVTAVCLVIAVFVELLGREQAALVVTVVFQDILDSVGYLGIQGSVGREQADIQATLAVLIV